MNALETLISEYAAKKELFSVDEVRAVVGEAKPGTPDATILWRLYEMVQKGRLCRIGRGKYAKAAKERFLCSVDETLRKKAEEIARNFPYASWCVWNVAMLGSFSRHQFRASYDIVEVEKEAAGSVVEVLAGSSGPCLMEQALLNVNLASLGNDRGTVVKTLVQEAPIANNNGVAVPSLEKLIVDLYCGGPALSFLQGHESMLIIEAMLARYTVNSDTLLRYASRRGKKAELKEKLLKLSAI